MRFILGLMILMTLSVHAEERTHHDYRRFWFPVYKGHYLAYCDVSEKKCGFKIATRYCQLMGYQRADQQSIAYNLGLTHYLDTRLRCKGWTCNGFKLIRCEGDHRHKPQAAYYYRYRTFVYPRYHNYRVAWCYTKKNNCGKRVAYSFCRRMGYSKASAFKIQNSIYATRDLGNQELCFGATCRGFARITCYR